MKYILTCCLLLLVSSCYKVEEKTTSASIKSPDYYRWSSLPKPLFMSAGYATLESETLAMMSEWNTPLNVSLLRLSPTPSSSSRFEQDFRSISSVSSDRHNGIYLVSNESWPSKSAGALGVTILMGRTNDDGIYLIEEADILIRDQTTYDLRTIIIHELGHFMGLGHSSTEISVMYESISSIDIKHTPIFRDLHTLAKLYNIAYGATPSKPSGLLKKPTGELSRIILELGADMNCRHLLNGVEIHSHKVGL